MSELTIGQLVKIILGLLVVVAVIGALYLIFKNKILIFFQVENSSSIGNLILGGLK